MGDVQRLARCLEAAVGERFVRDELAALVSEAIGPWVAHDGLRLFGMNPVTGAVSFGFLHDFSPYLVRAQLYDAYLGDDPFSPVDIARLRAPVGLLGGRDRTAEATQGHRRAREILAAHGAGCELRLLLRDGQGLWGLLALLRAEGGRPFDRDDADRLVEISPLLIALLRRYAIGRSPGAGGARLPAGVAVVGPDHEVRSLTPEAQAWMREIDPARGLAPEWMPLVSMREITLAARRHRIDPAAPKPLAYSPAAFLGRRVVVHAQPLDEDGTGDVAVVLQEATGPLLLSTFSAWHGLTARERQLVEHLYSGAAPKQIARSLDVSVHTVNTHVKAVFRKTGVSGRDELTAVLDS
ncbi:helix-turn-helix transcriptional regulator [Streptomyces sp. CBMA152]|uniref:helix-turn-helix transcriptional regulator n=1 Tax=Streptomyces sp. CBMA152 TaxID=1896312 RepID=UPI001660F43E|nr:helix-turn-helix transcriptional regulator [Streptomyces sp. CBMA152]